MLRRFVALTVLSLPPLLLGTGVASATQPPSPCASRLEGYGGMSVLEGNNTSDQNATAGGTGSVGCLLGAFHVQGDVFGDYNDVDKLLGSHTDNLTDVGGGAHFGLADPEVGNIEVNGAYNRAMVDESGPSGNVWRVGLEGEYFLDAATLGAQAGYLNTHLGSSSIINNAFTPSKGDGFYARGLLRYYVTENLKLEGLGGVGQIAGDTVPQARVLAEYRPQGWPVGFFVRGEGAWDNSFDEYVGTGGVRVYLFDSPATLRDTDRRYFREACTQFLVGTRTC